MANEELWEIWAPDGIVWSRWAKPALFAQMLPGGVNFDIPAMGERVEAEIVGWIPDASIGRCAIVADLPGDLAVVAGLSLAKAGWRPVPLFNTTDDTRALVPMKSTVAALVRGAQDLMAARLPDDAPPVFLIDSNRRGEPAMKASPGMYDNRWVVFPQDFPSASFLLSQGIRTAILLQTTMRPPQTDLAHVLLRWKEAGIRILAADHGSDLRVAPVDVPKPSRFRLAWARMMAMFGLRRNSAGGFGARIPEETTYSGGGGYYG